MFRAALLHHNSHDSVLICLSPLFVGLHNLIDPYVADEVSRNKHEITGDDPMCIYIAHRVPRGERLFGSHDRYNFETGVGLRPFGLPE